MTGPRISLLYFSGSGGTKLVAELVGEILSESYQCRITDIHDPLAAAAAAECELLVLLNPTYYLRAAPSMREFAESLGPFDPPRKAYVVATCELYSENSIRSLALGLRKRGLIVAGSKVVHAPGSDVTLVFPSVLTPWWYRFEKGLPEKLAAIARELSAIAEAKAAREAIPGLKWYTPFTQLLQLLFMNHFDRFRDRLVVLPDRCTLCGACVKCCDRQAWTMGPDGLSHSGERCELCTRCLHRCPKRALVLLKPLKDNRRLDSRLYALLRDEARNGLGLRGGRGLGFGRGLGEKAK
jgi:Fe-S-cluster-containing hydrogenase component 2